MRTHIKTYVCAQNQYEKYCFLSAGSPSSSSPLRRTNTLLVHYIVAELINTSFLCFLPFFLLQSAYPALQQVVCLAQCHLKSPCKSVVETFFSPNHYSPTRDVTATVREERIESEQKEIPPHAGEERVKPITEDQSGLGEHCKPPQ